MKRATRNSLLIHVGAVVVAVSSSHRSAGWRWLASRPRAPHFPPVAVDPAVSRFHRYDTIFGASGMGEDFRSAMFNSSSSRWHRASAMVVGISVLTPSPGSGSGSRVACSCCSSLRTCCRRSCSDSAVSHLEFVGLLDTQRRGWLIARW